MTKYIFLLSVLFLIATLLTPFLNPQGSFAIGIVSLLFGLSLTIYTIFQTHKGTENARPKILKEVGVTVLTLVTILFLGGIAAMLANYQVGMRWGEVAGLVSAIGASFMVGYLVRKGMMRFTEKQKTT